MDPEYKTLAFIVIAILYVVIGLMAAKGTICIFRKIFTARAEQTFYAIFLIVVAALYLAFAGYFGAQTAWQLEAAVVAGFVAIGLLGVRLPFALVFGYALHGLWDLVHEIQAHAGHSGFEPGRLTPIPLAYGFFCAAFDFYLVAYVYRRRNEWLAAWKSSAKSSQ